MYSDKMGRESFSTHPSEEESQNLKIDQPETERALAYLRHEINNALATLLISYDCVQEEVNNQGLDLGKDGKEALNDIGVAIENLKGIVSKATYEEVNKQIKGADVAERKREAKKSSPEMVGNKTIFVIDDEPPLARAIGRIVKGAFDNGNTPNILLFDSAKATKELIEQETVPDYILCDIMMPEMTGQAFYEWLKEKHPELLDHILFLSGGTFHQGGNEFIMAIEKKGILIKKPFNQEEVRNRVVKALDRGQKKA